MEFHFRPRIVDTDIDAGHRFCRRLLYLKRSHRHLKRPQPQRRKVSCLQRLPISKWWQDEETCEILAKGVSCLPVLLLCLAVFSNTCTQHGSMYQTPRGLSVEPARRYDSPLVLVPASCARGGHKGIIGSSEKGWIPQGGVAAIVACCRNSSCNSSCDTIARNSRRTIAFFLLFRVQ